MSDLHLKNVCKTFGSRVVLDNVTLTVASGTALSLLGPSGTGKSTLLSIATGLLAPDESVAGIAASAWLNGQNITSFPPEARGMGMVFQDAALFPHLSVEDNVAFGLKMRGMPQGERLRLAHAMLERVELGHKVKQWPETLSGGEQQRVALARALIIRPAVLLLDEPFAKLDPRLRQDMRRLVRALRQELGTTMLTVTHDGAEALADGDTVAVLLDGKLVQTGTPEELYEHPVSEAVARFFGEINVFVRDGVPVFIRPDCLTLSGEAVDSALDRGHVVKREYAGSYARLEIQTEIQMWIVYTLSGTPRRIGERVSICCNLSTMKKTQYE